MTATRDGGDRYGPMKWAQSQDYCGMIHKHRLSAANIQYSAELAISGQTICISVIYSD